MKYWLGLMCAICMMVNYPQIARATSEPDPEVHDLIQFLISDHLLIYGKDKQLVPLSYYVGNGEDVAKYFGDYICLNNNTCSVVDSIYSSPYAILGRGLPPQEGTELEKAQAQAQLERTDMKYGSDIYDGAAWQIALALAAKHHYLDVDKARILIGNQTRRIKNSSNRATYSTFKYGYKQAITDPEKAFVFRMVSTDYQNKDPFYNTRYEGYVSWDYDPEELAKQSPDNKSADYFKYVSTWSDWKPITGENAWAQLIGPLQAEYILNDGKVRPDSDVLNNAINSLYAFSAMQSAVGAFYYAPGGSDGNQGPIPKGEISMENNFSALGGLQILKNILLSTEQTVKVKQALKEVDVMLYGGKTVNGYDTLGLLSFFYNGAYDAEKGVFYTHGTAANPSSITDWKPDHSSNGSSMAVDVNTWGISALGAENIDRWYGKDTALKMWQAVREKGGYYNNGQLQGVGYTLNNRDEKIMSAEWTSGAINALHSLIGYYSKQNEDVTELKQDLEQIQQGILSLRNDKYLDSGFDGATPREYYVSVPQQSGKAYLYASKRYAIPFGWYANTLPSTTSNSWVIMNKFNFNPFQYQGKLSGERFPVPEKRDISKNDTQPENESLPHSVEIIFNAGNLGPINQLSLSYTLEGSDAGWVVAELVKGREGIARLPEGTKEISLAFNKGSSWFGVCQVAPAVRICHDKDCQRLKTINAQWSSDGKGDCGLDD